ncbi:UDP-N-acetylmuramoylalanyl-D-glutamate--2,6-diaminopimelate--D-alanyl-D-alanine ligase [Crocosphaera subtropica ATCC 51142]|uniref:UDP-N-acetylmuramoyl-tripeptide--D-alanyl-D-alanine ligase n=1 Tax=Crocosphaera subtropica (strain ATCC 51142 / BH68) TaxID=43989 RepID=B1WUB8_CROS5|nr:UDP-N-acetylmuramoyl-tripeptide--D-alanyl-D-alanine ligase [Crocosphaera subtropica]ACB53772.1 UDP-N-acetylmuramoylalanyl-D-glutamate--2,6-diaminopimelate--D-alanyl-D-alanine ligase [Crocosphaera subtropica ATCC 51142]
MILSEIPNILSNSLKEISQPLSNKLINEINTDTRNITENDIFLALKGDKFDGHLFAEKAIDKGAIALILNHKISVNSTKKIPQIIVKDTLIAYQEIANWWRNKVKIPIIGITGSVGKTTTKELISAVLGVYGKVHKTQANYNNEIGVPKTLLAITTSDDYAVIEMAMRARGEIALLSQIACPTIGIITNVGTAHIGRLGSREAIAEAKCELLAEMPTDSIAILNHDDQRLMETAAKVWQGKTITYGLEGGDITGKVLENQILRVKGMDFPLPLPGRHNALNYLAALAVTQQLNLDWHPLIQGVTVNLPQGRSQQYSLENDIILLDETYNAGLESMKAALQLLKDTPGKRHLAVLGTMKELGDASAQLHQEVGETAETLGIDGLYILVDDPEAQAIAQGVKTVETECFPTHEQLIQRLTEIIKPGDRILFKASNSVGLNRVVEAVHNVISHQT